MADKDYERNRSESVAAQARRAAVDLVNGKFDAAMLYAITSTAVAKAVNCVVVAPDAVSKPKDGQ